MILISVIKSITKHGVGPGYGIHDFTFLTIWYRVLISVLTSFDFCLINILNNRY